MFHSEAYFIENSSSLLIWLVTIISNCLPCLNFIDLELHVPFFYGLLAGKMYWLSLRWHLGNFYRFLMILIILSNLLLTLAVWAEDYNT